MLETVPSVSVALIVSVIDVPVGAVVADSVKLTIGGRSITVLAAEVLFVVKPTSSVALTYTLYEPARAYECISLVAVPARVSTVPSPQDTFRLVTVPSESNAVIARIIFWPVRTLVELSVKLTAGGLSVIVFVAEDVAVLPLLSVTVRITLYVPDLA